MGDRLRSATRALVVAVVALAMVASGCTGGDEESNGSSTTTVAAKRADSALVAQVTAALDAAPGCDALDTTRCMLPFPSDVFTKKDSSTSSGRRVNLPTGQLVNTKGTPLDPTEWNRNDGFSPGTPMLTLLPGVDLTKSGATTIDDIGRSVTKASASVVLDMTTGKRLPHWVEVDAAPGTPVVPPEQRLTIVRAATSLPEGHHIAVALVGMVDTSGTAIEPSPAFRLYRDRLTTDDRRIESRRGEMDKMLRALADAGVDRSKVTIAWDFTVASAESIAGPVLSLRDQAFAELGDGAPAFKVTETVTDPSELKPGVARIVRGTFDVPNYLTGDGSPGSRMTLDSDGKPQRGQGVITQPFSCVVPAAAVAGAGGTTRPVVYGHGLLGSHSEVENDQASHIAVTNDMLYCATDWIGFAKGDLGQAAGTLADISGFPAVADRSQQGLVGQLFMARLMRSPKGLSTDPAFQTSSGASIIDTTEAYYDGNSQGAIMGGAATAISTEWTKAVLGVPGMNYSILLSRSKDFDQYFVIMRGAYPDRTDQQLIYGVLQMLWDRFESNGFAEHMTDKPYANTPKHQVQLHVAFGDHQVANITAEIEARTIGAKLRTPVLADGRQNLAKPYWGLTEVSRFPFKGSLIEYWDSGTLPPPKGNITPIESPEFIAECGSLSEDEQEESAPCADPHERPRRAEGTVEQKDAFFRPDGEVIDACDAKPCLAPLDETRRR